jgi:predicted MFS family arabinose efflux permease
VFLASFIDDEKIVVGQMSPMGVFFYCYAGWGLTVRLTLRRLPERIGRRKVLLAGLLCMAIGMASYLAVSGERPWMILAPGLICGTGHALMFHTMTSLALEKFPPQMRGTGSALALMMLDLGMVVGSPILGWIADYFGFPLLFIAISSCCWLAFGVYLRDSMAVWRDRSPAAESV